VQRPIVGNDNGLEMLDPYPSNKSITHNISHPIDKFHPYCSIPVTSPFISWPWKMCSPHFCSVIFLDFFMWSNIARSSFDEEFLRIVLQERIELQVSTRGSSFLWPWNEHANSDDVLTRRDCSKNLCCGSQQLGSKYGRNSCNWELSWLL